MIRTVAVNIERSFHKRSVKAFDYGFYINKNDIVIQFKNKSVSECIKKLFLRVGITCGSVCDMPAKINGVYIKNVNEIIKELIKIQQDNDEKNIIMNSEVKKFTFLSWKISQYPIFLNPRMMWANLILPIKKRME